MAVKGGDILHVGESLLIERAQNAGPSQVNLSPEHLYELGNYLGIGTVYDIPDLSFSLESIDASAALEALLTGQDFSSMVDGDPCDIGACVNIDVFSQFKRGKSNATPYNVLGSVAVPWLTVESLSYKFGISDNASQSATLKGDSIFYNPGSVYLQTTVGSNTASQDITLTHLAYPYNGDTVNGVQYALGVKVRDTDGKTTRLFYGTDYTETVTGSGTTKTVHVIITNAVPATSHIDVMYASDTVAAYPQNSHTVPDATRPAAIRGRDIEVFVGGESLSNRWTSVQSVSLDWKATLQKDEEFSNTRLVGQDYDIPTVTGSIDIKPRTASELVAKVAQAAGTTTNEVTGALSSTPLELLIVLHSPIDGSTLKSLYVPDARLQVPGYNARVQQKLTVTMNFESDSGALTVYFGDKP